MPIDRIKPTSLHQLPENQSLFTAGRLRKVEHGWRIFNIYIELAVEFPVETAKEQHLVDGALVRLGGHRQGQIFFANAVELVHQQGPDARSLGTSVDQLAVGAALCARHEINRRIRSFFESRSFLEVETPAIVRAPGTDPHIEPVPATLVEGSGNGPQPVYLHTSPELAMKRLLAEDTGPIYRLGPVWRNGEVTELHNPEFTLLEWYRPWESVEAIITDVEDLVQMILDDNSARPVKAPFRRMTMQQVVDEACDFDILKALDRASLLSAIKEHGLLSERETRGASWDELFFSLTVSYLDPFLSDQGAVFVTRWPSPLAILAKPTDDDPRVSERFELYVDGIELTNGFGELTDPVEQRRRFEEDNKRRREMGITELPVPEAFLNALDRGMPPSAGVALGVDRLLMLATPGASEIRDIAPFALSRAGGQIRWP